MPRVFADAGLTSLRRSPEPNGQQQRVRGFFRELSRNKTLYLMALPAIILLIINNYIPMFGAIIAFKNINYVDGIFNSPWCGLKNFEFLFASGQTVEFTRNTLLYNAIFIVINTICSIAIAICLNELKSRRLSKFYQSTMFFPGLLSMVVVSYLVYAFLQPQYGFINKAILPLMGLKPVEWYNVGHYWMFILPIVNLWLGVGYSSILYLSTIVGMDSEIYEAAYVDGASKLQQIFKITLPQLVPLIIILTLLAIGNIFRSNFGLFYQVPRDQGQLYAYTQTIDTYVYRALALLGDIGMSSAAGLYQSVVGFILVIGSNLIVRKIDKEYALF